jgi:RND family efflux transporter MFP subunit
MLRTTAYCAAAALIVIAATACRNNQATAPPAAMPATQVVLTPATMTAIEDQAEYVGTLKSLHSTAIQPQIDGQITEILVKSGDRVRQGAPLVQIDPQRQRAAVESQEAERQAREEAVSFARQQQQRARDLFAAGAISRQEQEQADTALKTAEANLQALSAQVQQQRVQLRYFTVTAPAAGVIGDVPVRVGNQVSPQTILTTIDQNDTLEANVSVPIERAALLRIGLPMRILSSGGAPLASTTLSFVSPRVEDQTQSVLVKAQVRNPDGQLRPAQYIRARIIWKSYQSLVIPVTAVLRISGQQFAFVADDVNGQLIARQRAIKVGPISGDNYPVLEGIKPGDRIVTSGAMKLMDGAPIAPVAAGQNSAAGAAR